MKYSRTVKPISYLKAHASEVVREITNNKGTMIITQNGEAKVIVQDIHVYEQTQESLAMLKILALSSADIERGKVKEARHAFNDIRKRIDQRKDR